MRTVTNPTESVGSPQYMSPEQITTPSEIDARTDIWSLGAVMFELLTGALPFNGAGPAQVCASVLSQPVPEISDFRDDVPPALEFILLRCLEKNREQRFATVSDLSAALTAFAATGEVASGVYASPGAPRVSRARRRWLGALLSATVIGACGLVFGLGVREGRIRIPNQAELMRRIPADFSALRLGVDRALGRFAPPAAHSAE
jgi:serine/threonine protein kinase